MPAASVWERAARGYARQERLERVAITRAVDLARAAAGEVVLDVATGTGLVLRELARRSARPAQAIGVDASAAMLARVGPLPDGFRTVHADATALPIADASVDVALASYLLHVLEPGDRAAVLAELHRVVRPGGRLVVVTVWAPRREARAVLAGLARAAPMTLGGLKPLDPRDELEHAGWAVGRASSLRRGYPSLVALADRVSR